MASLPAHPDRPHDFFRLPDTFASVEAPGLYRRALRIRVKDVGSGPPLLLVHGLQTSAYSWRFVISDLAAAGFRVIVPDVVGCGLSDHPADFGYAPERVADLLDALRESLGVERWSVVGNSLGGLYASALAARHGAHVDRLVVIHAPGFMRRAPMLGIELLRRGLVPRAASRIFGPWLVHRYLRYHAPGRKSLEDVAEFSRAWSDLEGRRAAWHIIRDALGPEREPDLPALLGTISMPTLLVWARNDTLIPPGTARRWKSAIPNATLEWVDEASHFVQVDQPERTVELVTRFVAAPAP